MIRKTVIARSVAMALGIIAAGVYTVPVAYAQSNTNGTIIGQVTAGPGVTVAIENLGTGAKRTLTPDSAGRFQATALPPGSYKITVMMGAQAGRSEQVEVLAGQGTELNLSAAGTQTIVIAGSRVRSIDVSRADSGATFTAKDIDRLPVAQNVAAIVQLAPNTTRADFRYGNNAASFGGSGSSENAIYINGFPVTNALYQVGYSSLPFGAIAQTSILTGGYGAEFGRSTGGVINITTKSGGNEFEFSTGVRFAPNSLRSKARNLTYPNTGATENAATDGKIFFYNEGNKQTETAYNVSLSGPIIKDRLFFFAATEYTKTSQETTRLSAASTAAINTGWLEQDRTTPRSILKLDWAITDSHLIEFTGIRDKVKTEERFFGFNYATLSRDTTQRGGASFVNYGAGVPFLNATGAALAAPQGANVNILKYTGNLTDDLTVQVLYGTSKTDRSQIPVGYVPGLYPIAAPVTARAPGVNYTPTQVQGFTSALLRDDAGDDNTGSRFDVEYKLNSQHTLRAGLDYNHIKGRNGTSSAGGGTWTYGKLATPGTIVPGMTTTPAGPLGSQGYYVTEDIVRGGGNPEVKQSAWYIEDRFQLSKDLLIALGLRNEAFNNLNSVGDSIIKKNKQLAPRASVAWDVNGDQSFKVFGTAGRYHLGIPANLAVRFASGSLNTQQFYSYTGVDPVTGAPQGLVKLNPNLYSPNNEFGVPPDARVISATDIRSNTQDEFTIGFEKALTPEWKGGVRLNVRKLKSSIDDVSDPTVIANKLRQRSVAEGDYFEGHWQGALFNPGQSNTFLVPVDAAGTLRQVTMAWNEWGFPEGLKRQYTALDFLLEHPLRDGWYGKMTYTWSKSTGNTEGQQKSDNGQADVGFTSVWDFPQLMLNSNGPLPNQRKHQIKAFGVYNFSDEYAISGNALISSGRPKSATCNLPVAVDTLGLSSGYGSIFYVCPDAPGRGGLGTLPWEKRFDIGFIYKPSLLPGLTAKVEVFNLFNTQTATAVNEARNTVGGQTSATSQQVINYSAPRAVQFSAQYTRKF